MNPLIRPIACARAGEVHVFVGAAWQAMPVAAAEILHSQLAEAIEQAKSQQEAIKV